MPFIQSFQKSGYGLFSSTVSPYLTLTYINTVDISTSTTLTHPANVLVGDVCLLLQYGYDNDSEDFTSANTPSGFSSVVATPNIGTIQTSMNISFRVLTATTSVTVPQPGMDNYGYIAVYYRLSGGTLQGTTATAGTSSVVTGAGPISSTLAASSANIAYLSFVATSSYNGESLPFSTGIPLQITQYGSAAPAYASLSFGISYGPQGSGTAEAEGFSGSETYVGVASGRIGFTKAGV